MNNNPVFLLERISLGIVFSKLRNVIATLKLYSGKFDFRNVILGMGESG